MNKNIQIILGETTANKLIKQNIDRILEYFHVKNNDASLVSWSHAVNNKQKLKETLSSIYFFSFFMILRIFFLI